MLFVLQLFCPDIAEISYFHLDHPEAVNYILLKQKKTLSSTQEPSIYYINNRRLSVTEVHALHRRLSCGRWLRVARQATVGSGRGWLGAASSWAQWAVGVHCGLSSSSKIHYVNKVQVHKNIKMQSA